MSYILKNNKIFLNTARYLISILLSIIFLAGLYVYTGNKLIYLSFGLLNIYLIYFAFRKNASFFETFFSVLLFFGFGFKFSIIISFTDGMFREGVGNFDYSASSFDFALTTSSLALLSFIVAGHLREFFFNYPSQLSETSLNKNFYKNNRLKIIFFFLILIFSIFTVNVFFAVYQKGLVPINDYNFFFSGFIKWSLLYGLTAIATLIIFLEINSFKKFFSLTVLLAIFETFISSISMLSRGMIFNAAAIIFGIYKFCKKKKIIFDKKYFFLYIIFTILLFYISVISVNHIRSNFFYIGKSVSKDITDMENYKKTPKDAKDKKILKPKRFNIIDSNNEFFYLAVNRWVGIDAVLAVTQNRDKLNFSLIKESLKEKFIKNEPTFYEKTFNLEQQVTIDIYENVKGNTLTGIIAFLFYPGSFLFLISGMIILTFFANFIEYISFKFSEKNIVFSCLVGQIIAFRYIHFGYLPKQSYLLFGSIFLTIFFVYLFTKLLKK